MYDITRESAEADTRRFGLAAAFAAAVFALTPAAHAADQAPGMRIVKDPVTGQLRAPTAEEAAALSSSNAPSKALRQSAPRGLVTGKVGPAAIRHADGTVEQELDESSLQYTVMTKNADGTFNTVCVTGADAADAALKGTKNSIKVAKAAKEHNHDHK